MLVTWKKKMEKNYKILKNIVNYIAERIIKLIKDYNRRVYK